MSEDILSILERFNAAFNRHDADGMMALMAPDCVFENTYPAPDGTRYRGWEAVRGYWIEFFQTSAGARLDFEEVATFEDRAVQRWVYSWQGDSGAHGRVRGIDLFRFRDGLITEKLSYVKG
jgi:ketosteroid isomerase-like protein